MARGRSCWSGWPRWAGGRAAGSRPARRRPARAARDDGVVSGASAGDVSRIEQSMATPARGEQPCSGSRDRWRFGGGRRACIAPGTDLVPLPAVEPPSRGGPIERSEAWCERPGRRGSLGSVPACVQQHVAERVPHLRRGRQQSSMVAIRQDWSRSSHHPIHRPRQPRSDGLHPAPERVTVAGLDDQVRVVALQRVVDQAKLRAVASLRERSFELPNEPDRSQRHEPRPQPERHVRRCRPAKSLA